MNTLRFSLGAVALCLTVGLPALTAAHPAQVAMTAQAAHVTMAHPITVNNCSPQKNVSYNWAGYTP
ncbi:MAG TPA: hypothetical protein VN909_02310, partial [Candidatus Dormibacteraeota bacterium]|nr:hypothetical protein [Candidatus Dormibacteraeota bacterium]